jgi:hypothetical protein
MKIIKSFQVIILSISFIFANTLYVPTNASAVITPPLTKCNIRVDNPHISENLLRTRGILAVKVNARSKCNKPMRNLVLTVEIYKIGFFRDQKVADEKEAEPGLIFANKVIKNEKTYFKCTNTNRSRYYGIAFATATMGRKFVKTFHVITEKTIALNCGN